MYIKAFLIIFITIISLTILAIVFYYKSLKPNIEYTEKFKKSSFQGIIYKINYDLKKIPTVRLSDSNYNLGPFSYSVSKYIQINDSLLKEYNTMDYILYRKDSNGVWQLIYGEP